MKKLLGVFALLLLVAACGDFQWFPDANPNVDTTPDQFSFSPNQYCGVVLDQAIHTTTPITVSGLSADTPTSISIAGGEYSINGGTYTSANGTITNGQTVNVQPPGGMLTANQPDAVMRLTIGGVSTDVFFDSQPICRTTPSI